MTSASELFYSRRSRHLRSPEPVLRPAPAEVDRERERDRDREHHHRPGRRQHRHRLHYHDCGPPRHMFHGGAAHGGRHLCDRGALQSDIVGQDFGTSESSLGSNSNNEISSRNNRLRLATSDRLPGAVLQARARLLERLRGISLTGSRQNTSTSGVSWDEFIVSDDFRVVDLGEWETDELERLDPGSSFLSSISRPERSPSLPNRKEKKPPGLALEAINMLPREAFKALGGSNVASKASLECSICLDKFWEGELLIRLACGHRFHPECLSPWVRTCGDCPYCRSRIFVNPGAEERLSGVTFAC